MHAKASFEITFEIARLFLRSCMVKVKCDHISKFAGDLEYVQRQCHSKGEKSRCIHTSSNESSLVSGKYLENGYNPAAGIMMKTR